MRSSGSCWRTARDAAGTSELVEIELVQIGSSGVRGEQIQAPPQTAARNAAHDPAAGQLPFCACAGRNRLSRNARPARRCAKRIASRPGSRSGSAKTCCLRLADIRRSRAGRAPGWRGQQQRVQGNGAGQPAALSPRQPAPFPAGESPHRCAAFDGDAAFVRRGVAKDERKERGLARAVRADEADAVAAVDLQRGVVKKGAAAEGLGDLGYGEHGAARSVASAGTARKGEMIVFSSVFSRCRQRPLHSFSSSSPRSESGPAGRAVHRKDEEKIEEITYHAAQVNPEHWQAAVWPVGEPPGRGCCGVIGEGLRLEGFGGDADSSPLIKADQIAGVVDVRAREALLASRVAAFVESLSAMSWSTILFFDAEETGSRNHEHVRVKGADRDAAEVRAVVADQRARFRLGRIVGQGANIRNNS